MSDIRLEQVRKTFNQARPNAFDAIRGIDLEIGAGQVTVFKGPSGSGKTTLLSMIGCLSRPTSGRIYMGGRLLSGLPERFMTEVRRSTFGFIFQQFNLVRGLTVLDNVMLPAYPLGPVYSQLRREARMLLDRFGLDHRDSARVETLSGGEAQRTAICRALINQPQVLIADEPTANLDSVLANDFMGIVGELRREGKTVLLSSHDPLVCDSPLADRVVEVQDGQVVGDRS